jgi:hypothetical protein
MENETVPINRRQVLKANPPQQPVDAYDSDETSTLYIDGVNRINLQSGVTRLELYVLDTTGLQPGLSSAAAGGAPPEQRVITHNLVLPTRAFVELLNNAIRSLKSQQSNIITAFETDIKRIGTVVDNVDVK